MNPVDRYHEVMAEVEVLQGHRSADAERIAELEDEMARLRLVIDKDRDIAEEGIEGAGTAHDDEHKAEGRHQAEQETLRIEHEAGTTLKGLKARVDHVITEVNQISGALWVLMLSGCFLLAVLINIAWAIFH